MVRWSVLARAMSQTHTFLPGGSARRIVTMHVREQRDKLFLHEITMVRKKGCLCCNLLLLQLYSTHAIVYVSAYVRMHAFVNVCVCWGGRQNCPSPKCITKNIMSVKHEKQIVKLDRTVKYTYFNSLAFKPAVQFLHDGS